MKWLGVSLIFLLAGLLLYPVVTSGTPGVPLGEATFVVG